MRTLLTRILVAITLCLPGCSRAPAYQLQGQVLAVDRDRREITIKHGDIRGFMPGMTMPFTVREPQRLDGFEPGDLVQATLVVGRDGAYLSSIERTGHAPLAEAPPPRPPAPIAPGQPVPDVPLVDETGSPRAVADWRGKTLAVTFIYTRCPLPDFCPRMDQQFKRVQADVLRDEGLRDRVRLLSVSFDPSFDTPARLAAHATQVGADPRVWHFVTGTPDDVAAFGAAFGVSVVRDGQEVLHNLRTAVVAPDGRVAKVFDGNDWTPDELLAAVRQAH